MKGLFITLVLTVAFCTSAVSQTLQTGYYGTAAVCYNKKADAYKMYLETYKAEKGETACRMFCVLKNGKIYSCAQIGGNNACNEEIGTYKEVSSKSMSIKIGKPMIYSADVTLTAAKDWKNIKMIKSEKSMLFSDMSVLAPTNGFVVTGDIVKVLKKNGDWLYVEYQNFTSKGKPILAWVEGKDCYGE